MGSLYNQADIYDLFEHEYSHQLYADHWKTLLQGKRIRSMLDVSIGTGSVTLPILELGISLCGSDLNEGMLANCRKKLNNQNHTGTLTCSDFRDLSCWGEQKFDLVASTGNSLGHVCNDDVLRTLEQMDAHVATGGYLYVDTRNWEKILHERNRFYVYNPLFVGDHRVTVVQVWDYHVDKTMTFNLLYTFEKDSKIVQRTTCEEHYFPFSKELLWNKLLELGYADMELRAFPAQRPLTEFETTDWYAVIAHKTGLDV